MFQHKIDELRSGATRAIGVASLALGAAAAAFVTLCFLCAAAFVCILDRYGLIQACFAGAGVFLVVTIFLAISYLIVRRRKRRQPEEPQKSQMQAMMLDPMVVAAGIQIIRAVGIKRLVPILAIGGVVLGMMARPSSQRTDDDGVS